MVFSALTPQTFNLNKTHLFSSFDLILMLHVLKHLVLTPLLFVSVLYCV